MNKTKKPNTVTVHHDYLCHWVRVHTELVPHLSEAVGCTEQQFRRLFIQAAETPTPQQCHALIKQIKAWQERNQK